MKRNTNNKLVVTRADHNCMHCGTYIKAGTHCRTLSAKGHPRGWLCRDCETVYRECISAIDNMNSIYFNDDGAAYANADCIDEVYEKWFNRQVGKDTFLDKYLLIRLNG